MYTKATLFVVLFFAAFTLATALTTVNTAFADGVASGSLSSAIPFDNPAVQAYQREAGFVHTQIYEEDAAGATVLDSSNNRISFLFDPSKELSASYFNLAMGSNNVAGVSEKTAEAGMGFFWENVAFGGYQRTSQVAGATKKVFLGQGFVFTAFDWFYIGVNQDVGPGSENHKNSGAALKFDDIFRIEASTNKTTDAAGATTSVQQRAIEVQWKEFILGSHTEVTGTITKTKTFIAWDRKVLDIALAKITSTDPAISGGTVISINFARF